MVHFHGGVVRIDVPFSLEDAGVLVDRAIVTHLDEREI